MTYTVGSLFSGIGGLDLGLERAGMKVVWQSEIDPFACKVLKKHWPRVVNHGDIKQIDWGTVEPVDIICGGYPCQPFSTAGKRKGTDDPRHLWPWVRTAISELRPQYAILENVRGHLSMGGLQVIGELAEIGYDAEWRVVSAAGLGAPHRRDRIIIVAYPNSGDAPDGGKCTHVQSQDQSWGDDGTGSGSHSGQVSMGGARQDASNVAYPCEQQLNGGGHQHSPREIKKRKALQEQVDRGSGYVAYTKGSSSRGTKPHHLLPRVWQTTELGEQNCSTRSIGDWWETEPDVGRVADGIPHRVDRLRGLGNAVVPQVAEYIGRLITTS
jgi:DNA (cytosine-5)-methyltransferase 1